MRKIDGHVHLVKAQAGYNLHGRLTMLEDGYAIWDDGTLIKLLPDGWGSDTLTAEKLLEVMDQTGISQAVLMQGSLNGYQNYYSYQVAKKYPDRFLHSFAVDPFAQNASQIMNRYTRDLGVRILKLEISQGGGLHGYHEAFRLDTCPQVDRLLRELSKYPGAVVVIDYGASDQISHQPQAIANLAKTYPKLDFVVCHLSFPENLVQLENSLKLWQDLPNVFTDLSAIQDILGETQKPYQKSKVAVDLALEVLGSKRLIWGSDAPWSATFNAYADLSTWLEETYPSDQVEDMMEKTAHRVYFKPENVQALKAGHDPVLESL